MSLYYQNTPYHFDLSGVNNTSRYSRGLYKTINGDSGFPDFILYQRSHPDFGDYIGLAIEVKADGVTVRKRDGNLVADQHIRDQAAWLQRLSSRGYYAVFGIGWLDIQELIDKYMTGTSNTRIEF
ncbi:hypothetical protein GS464_29475 [Rhodococcus hoagii]|nr:hypothetical protein [Prescottella equi]